MMPRALRAGIASFLLINYRSIYVLFHEPYKVMLFRII
jgi:hypothetical protein